MLVPARSSHRSSLSGSTGLRILAVLWLGLLSACHSQPVADAPGLRADRRLADGIALWLEGQLVEHPEVGWRLPVDLYAKRPRYTDSL